RPSGRRRRTSRKNLTPVGSRYPESWTRSFVRGCPSWTRESWLSVRPGRSRYSCGRGCSCLFLPSWAMSRATTRRGLSDAGWWRHGRSQGRGSDAVICWSGLRRFGSGRAWAIGVRVL
ncbi:hypothetical protein CH063_13121, partial [Colletotrichum higginsianum]